MIGVDYDLIDKNLLLNNNDEPGNTEEKPKVESNFDAVDNLLKKLQK